MRRLLSILVALAIAGAAVFWFLTKPVTDDAAMLDGIAPDLARGEQVFDAAGCASCHAAEGATGDARLVLAGGQGFDSEFGTFHAPNISSDPQHGIGDWAAIDLWNAMHHGVSPEGAHLYPAFPYTTYVRATPEDVVSLHAYLQTLPADPTPSLPHEVGFPFNMRILLGGWKFLFLDDAWTVAGDLTEQEIRGRYLAESLGHCAECHTPRNALGGLDRARWLGGAPNPSGEGRIPNITPAALDWSEADLVEYFTSGFTPDFDSAGGEMVEVIENLAQLPEEDRAAIAAYLKKVPPVE